MTPEHQRALTLMRFMSDFREAMWGVVQQALSDLDFDFAAYAEQHFERLGQTAADRAFRRALWARATASGGGLPQLRPRARARRRSQRS